MATAPAPIGIAPRILKPKTFAGTDVAWRVLCDLYPSAETPEIVMAVVEYCAARKLDPLRRPVHIVPMYNAKLRRRVQIVMQGINEIETTAHRTGLWAGMDEPTWGPVERRKFRGAAAEDDERAMDKGPTELEVDFPQWCSVKVYRLVDGSPRAFSEPVFWIEAYGRAGFRSELPNARWRQAPRQMLQKCAKSAALRAAFPEEVGYSAEEMEGHEIDAGGITIEGTRDFGSGEPPNRPEKRTGFASEVLDERPPPREAAAIEDTWDDPIGALLAEVARMDLIDLERAETSAEWRKRVVTAAIFPPDEDRLRDAVEARKAELRTQRP
jgi:phage recombination protein Bet